MSDSLQRLSAGEWQWPIRLDAGQGFGFSCSSCGSCCRGEMTIRLNLADLQRMAGYLGFERTGTLFDEGWVEERPGDEQIGFRPAIRFRPGPGECCPFLENVLDDEQWMLSGRCRLHPDLKPLVCKLAPLGREVAFDASMGATEQWVFTEPVQGCPGCRVDQLQRAAAWCEPHTDELAIELQYFRVMESLTRSRAPVGVFRRFHRDLEVAASIGHYLECWLNGQARGAGHGQSG